MREINNKVILFSMILFISEISSLINNPVTISENVDAPIVHSTNSYYYIIVSGKIIQINKENDSPTTNTMNIIYTSPFVFMITENNDYFLIGYPNKYYYIIFPKSIVTKSMPAINYPNLETNFGYIQEVQYSKECSGNNCICDIQANEFILYGMKAGSNSTLVFSFLNAVESYEINFGYDIEQKTACGALANGQYICAVIKNNTIGIKLFYYVYSSSNNKCSLQFKYSINSFGLNDMPLTFVELYDTNQKNKKLVCAKHIETYNTKCLQFYIDNNPECTTECTFSPIITYWGIITIPTTEKNSVECGLSNLGNENLYCCGGTNFFKCARLRSDFTFIESFNLHYSGTFTNFYIFSDGGNFYDIFFFDKNSKNLYKHSIYKPICNNLAYSILVYKSLSINVENIFSRKTNHNYYIQFSTFPNNYGDLKIENTNVSTENKILLSQNYILSFTSTNDITVNEFQISYNISIPEGFYSQKCNIKLTILPCYNSCSRCTNSSSHSDSSNHNCEENKCKTNYYPSPTSLTNCYNDDTKNANWYLDTSNQRYANCDSTCATCSGSASNNCLSCYSKSTKPQNAYLYKNECINICPEGTYASLQNEGYYICYDCYQNCKTCSDGGNKDNMNCDTCPENNIIYNKNCYIEKDSSQKTFYKAESTTEITSCYQSFHYYIEENTFTCENSMPNIGYFLVNSNTGLYAQCHSDCKTCSDKSDSISTNCNSCINDSYFLLDKNCISECPEGYYSTISNTNLKICKKCYQYCKSCNEGEDEFNHNCDKCIQNYYFGYDTKNCYNDSIL